MHGETFQEKLNGAVAVGLAEVCDLLAEVEVGRGASKSNKPSGTSLFRKMKMRCTQCGYTWKPHCNRPFRAKRGNKTRILRSLKRCPRCHKRAEVLSSGGGET